MAEQEGVIKYHLDHRKGPLPEEIDIAPLIEWRARLVAAGLVGEDPARYDGYGFGNLSMRLGEGFLITGSQTGDVTDFGREHFAWVKEAFPEDNCIISTGPCRPSSESLTHAALYAAQGDICFVFHGHSPEIWTISKDLALPETAPVPYGTPEMAQEVMRLLSLEETRSKKIFTMAGHEDGVMTFGKTADEAGRVMLDALANARAGKENGPRL